MITGRVITPDGTLILTRHRAVHPELYSGKCHRSGAAVQILSDTQGQLRNVGELIAGSLHDVTAFRQTGLANVLAEHMNENLVRRQDRRICW
jgi:DDE superfamily endonuclease